MSLETRVEGALPARLTLPLVALASGLLLALLSLFQPAWFYREHDVAGNDWYDNLYGAGSLTEEKYRSGRLSERTITPYSSPSFDDRLVAGAAGNFALATLAYIGLVAFAALVAFRGWRSRAAPPLSTLKPLLLLALLAGLGVAAYLYLAMGPAATFDLGGKGIAGFSGQRPVGGGNVVTWGPAAGWYLILGSVLLMLLPAVRVLKGHDVTKRMS